MPSQDPVISSQKIDALHWSVQCHIIYIYIYTRGFLKTLSCKLIVGEGEVAFMPFVYLSLLYRAFEG